MIMSKWTEHLKDDKEKQEFENSVRRSLEVLKRLKDMVEDQIDQSETTSLKTYDCPSWAYKQADINGYKRSLNFINNLLTGLDQQKEII